LAGLHIVETLGREELCIGVLDHLGRGQGAGHHKPGFDPKGLTELVQLLQVIGRQVEADSATTLAGAVLSILHGFLIELEKLLLTDAQDKGLNKKRPPGSLPEGLINQGTAWTRGKALSRWAGRQESWGWGRLALVGLETGDPGGMGSCVRQ